MSWRCTRQLGGKPNPYRTTPRKKDHYDPETTFAAFVNPLRWTDTFTGHKCQNFVTESTTTNIFSMQKNTGKTQMVSMVKTKSVNLKPSNTVSVLTSSIAPRGSRDGSSNHWDNMCRRSLPAKSLHLTWTRSDCVKEKQNNITTFPWEHLDTRAYLVGEQCSWLCGKLYELRKLHTITLLACGVLYLTVRGIEWIHIWWQLMDLESFSFLTNPWCQLSGWWSSLRIDTWPDDDFFLFCK